MLFKSYYNDIGILSDEFDDPINNRMSDSLINRTFGYTVDQSLKIDDLPNTIQTINILHEETYEQNMPINLKKIRIYRKIEGYVFVLKIPYGCKIEKFDDWNNWKQLYYHLYDD